jgi:ABC-type Fe3+ transport system permease subunit
MRKILLTVTLAIGTIWFLFAEFIALLMGSGLADEPGDTNGFKRFLFFSLFALPGLAVAIVCVISLRRDRSSTQHGFPITLSEPCRVRTADRSHEVAQRL